MFDLTCSQTLTVHELFIKDLHLKDNDVEKFCNVRLGFEVWYFKFLTNPIQDRYFFLAIS